VTAGRSARRAAARSGLGFGTVDGIDLAALRTERLERLQAAMRARDVDGCLLFHESNIRYATGASAMPVWNMTSFVRCAVVPVEGVPILFEHANSIHRSRLAVADVRPFHQWEFYDDADRHAAAWAHETVAAMRELGIDGGRLALDRIGTPGWFALDAAGVRPVDSAPVTTAAREIKTPAEMDVMRMNGGIVVDMLSAFEDAIAPGVTERDLLAVHASTLLERGGEHLSTNTVCSGPNTNPWRAEATERALRPGDLVFVDTDCVGVEGYFSCVSRTFPVGSEATPEQRRLYRDAFEWLGAMRAVIRPGVRIADLAREAPPMPERYLAQRYEVMFHGIGLEEESPSLSFPIDEQSNADRVLEEGMALVVELYAGEVGAADGVKLGDQVLVTGSGTEVLSPSPFSEALLA
jgi:Xaa-Pro dipeptidase